MSPPEPAFATTEENAYTFERVVISSLPFPFPYFIEMHAVLQARVQGAASAAQCQSGTDTWLAGRHKAHCR